MILSRLVGAWLLYAGRAPLAPLIAGAVLAPPGPGWQPSANPNGFGPANLSAEA
jgi:hypothetical protein